MSIRDHVFGLLVRRGAVAADDDPVGIVSRPLFTSGLVESVQFLKLLLMVEAELGVPLEEADLQTELFDTVEAIEALMARYQLAGAPGADA